MEHIEDQRSADFGEASHLDNYDKSADQSHYNPLTPPPQREKTPTISQKSPPPKPKEKTPPRKQTPTPPPKESSREKTPPPRMDKDGHSDESSENMVANHDPFKGI